MNLLNYFPSIQMVLSSYGCYYLTISFCLFLPNLLNLLNVNHSVLLSGGIWNFIILNPWLVVTVAVLVLALGTAAYTTHKYVIAKQERIILDKKNHNDRMILERQKMAQKEKLYRE